jgi:surfactin synthase thioesterase subunit
VEVLAIQYPGRQDRRHEPGIADIGTLVDEVAGAVAPYADRPIAVFGHSMGAIVGYELALRLCAAGDPPVRLFASGRRAPSRYRNEMVHQRDDVGILAELEALSGTQAGLLADPELRADILASVRCDYRAVETYRHVPGRTVGCPITVLAGEADRKVTSDEARAWGAHTTASLDLVTYPGAHFFLSEHWPAVATLITYLMLDREPVGGPSRLSDS